MSESFVWYMFRCEPRHELSVGRQLMRGGIYVFVPRRIERVRSGVGGRRGPKVTHKPIAAHGYVFVARDRETPNLHDLAPFRALKSPVGFGGIPVRISNATMRNWSVQLTREESAAPDHGLKKGDAVIIKEGPFATFPGVVDESAGALVKVLVDIFGRSTPVWIGAEDVETPEQRSTRMGAAARRLLTNQSKSAIHESHRRKRVHVASRHSEIHSHSQAVSLHRGGESGFSEG